METNKPKTPQKGAGSRLRELSKKRREQTKPSKELLEILKSPAKNSSEEKKSAISENKKDLEM